MSIILHKIFCFPSWNSIYSDKSKPNSRLQKGAIPTKIKHLWWQPLHRCRKAIFSSNLLSLEVLLSSKREGIAGIPAKLSKLSTRLNSRGNVSSPWGYISDARTCLLFLRLVAIYNHPVWLLLWSDFYITVIFVTFVFGSWLIRY